MMHDGDLEGALIASQLKHTVDLLKAEIRRLRDELEHQKDIATRRLNSLEAIGEDHEDRIRAATNGVTQLKVWAGFSTGGSWVVSLIALLRTWVG